MGKIIGRIFLTPAYKRSRLVSDYDARVSVGPNKQACEIYDDHPMIEEEMNRWMKDGMVIYETVKKMTEKIQASVAPKKELKEASPIVPSISKPEPIIIPVQEKITPEDISDVIEDSVKKYKKVSK